MTPYPVFKESHNICHFSSLSSVLWSFIKTVLFVARNQRKSTQVDLHQFKPAQHIIKEECCLFSAYFYEHDSLIELNISTHQILISRSLGNDFLCTPYWMLTRKSTTEGVQTKRFQCSSFLFLYIIFALIHVCRWRWVSSYFFLKDTIHIILTHLGIEISLIFK